MKAVLVLDGMEPRIRAIDWIKKAPRGTRVEFKGSRRSIAQNAYWHVLLTQIATTTEWHGKKRSVTDWKRLFVDGLHREGELVPSLDGEGVVKLGDETSDLDKQDFSDLIELTQAWMAKHEIPIPPRKTEKPEYE